MRQIVRCKSTPYLRLINIAKRCIGIDHVSRGAIAMTVSAKIAILVDAMKHGGGEIAKIPPAERGRLAAVLRWCAAEIDPPKKVVPIAGVLSDLKTGRAHD
jgi:hypothetical protein